MLNAADALERFAQIDTVAFDKTGTLTSPHPCVVNARDFDPDVVEHAASLARASSHPLARAVARARPDAPLLADATEERGQGVRALIDGAEARLGSPVFVGLRRSVARLARRGR